MSGAASVEEIIGGIDNGGGIPQQDEDEGRSSLAGGEGADGQGDLWLQNLALTINIYGVVALSKTAFITVMWWFYYLAGTNITSYYWWTWFTSMLTVYIAWGPTCVAYILLLTETSFAQTLFFYASLWSIIGPLIGYFFPLVILVLAYNEKQDTGLTYSSEIHFWLGWFMAVWITILSIMFEFAFLPGIRVWYELKNGDGLVTEEEVEDLDKYDPNEIFIPEEEPEEVEDEDIDNGTTFISNNWFAF